MGLRPNLLIIHAHDLGRHTSVYGAGVTTPALQRFAEQSMVFSNAWSCAPTCSPSRAALLTGRYPHEAGMLGLAHLGFSLERTDLHLSAELRRAGYDTVLAGVQHEVPDHRMLSYNRTIGADPHAPYRGAFDPPTWDRDNAAAVETFIRDADPDTASAPWFLFWGLFEPHRPFDVGSGTDTPAVAVPPGLPDTDVVRREYAAFLRSVRRADVLIGRVLAALDRTGHADNTMVIITSDHGIDFPRYKCTLSPGGLGVQLMVRRPGQQAGLHTDALVSTVDVLPTVREELRLPAVKDDAGGVGNEGAEVAGPGRSLLPLWENTGHPVRRYAFAEMNYHVAYDPARSVYDGRYHLVRHNGDERVVAPNIGDSPVKDLMLSDGRGAPLSRLIVPPREGLYDVWFDPLQNNNLLATPGDPPVDYLRDVLDRWMAETDDPLLAGDVPAPAGAAVAPRDAYSSTTADAILADNKEAHS